MKYIPKWGVERFIDLNVKKILKNKNSKTRYQIITVICMYSIIKGVPCHLKNKNSKTRYQYKILENN